MTHTRSTPEFPARFTWTVRGNHTPVFEIRYWNGAVQGRSYQYGSAERDGQPAAELFQIDNATNNKARELFTVSGGDKPATAMYARLKKVGSPSSLSIQLRRTSDFAVLASVDLPASAISSTDHVWVGGSIDYMLADGQQYDVLVKENSGGGVGHYEAFPLREGSAFTTGFLDGSGQISVAGSSFGTWDSSNADMQFYFLLSE